MTDQAKQEIDTNMEVLRITFGWKENQLGLIRAMIEASYLQGHIDGYKVGSDRTVKIMEDSFNGK